METPESISNFASETATVTPESQSAATPQKPEGSYVKHAMRNMVRKRGTSIKHFVLTTVGLLSVLVGLAYITR